MNTAALASDEKRQLLARLVEKKARQSNRYPLSFAQQRLWFLYELDPDSPAYNIPVTIRFKGQLDEPALQKSLEEIVKRHGILRTRFVKKGDSVKQTFDENGNVPLQRIDLSNAPEAERENRAKLRIREEALNPFDLMQGELLRVMLFRLTPAEHIIVLNMHHMVSDYWSMGILTREFKTLYSSFLASKDPELPELPIQYVDFAAWQQKTLQGETLEKLVSYWSTQLADLPVLNLPIDKKRPKKQTSNGAQEFRLLSNSLSNAINKASRAFECTQFMLLLAAFKTLIYRYSGQDDIAIGSPIANRNREETENLIGFFANTLVLRSQFSGDQTFADLLQQVKATTLAAYEHQDFPFEKLVEVIQLERDISRAPLFQVMFSFQRASMEEMELPGLVLTPFQLDGETAKFDLTVTVTEREEGFSCSFVYNTDLFHASTIKRMTNSFEVLLNSIVENPKAKLHELPILTDHEQQDLLCEWSGLRSGMDRLKPHQPSNFQQQSVHGMIEAQAQLTPENTAVIFENQQLSYQQLNQQANQLARYLQNRGVGPEKLVGLFFQRSIEMIVALLGVLKTGAAYVPMEPSIPGARLKYMADDAELEWILTTEDLIDRLPWQKDNKQALYPQILPINQESILEERVRCSHHNLKNSSICRDQRSYMMYTSGSTGTPKGVEVLHSGVVNYLNHVKEQYFSHEAGSVVSSPLSFDATITSLLGPLVSGKTVRLLAQDGKELERITDFMFGSDDPLVFKITPAHLEGISQLIDQNLNSKTPHRIIVGGEPFNCQLAKTWKKDLLPNAIFENEYGPTETVVGCSTYAVEEMDVLEKLMIQDHLVAVPIGKAIRNTQLYVLDEWQNLCPVGVPGELYIGGYGVAKGYLKRPELTADKFIDNPFAPTFGCSPENGKLYRTGDLVRWLPDINGESGHLEYLGRLDDQVKIRGFRVELGEIEALLSKEESITQVVVLLRQKDSVLVAYLAVNQPLEGAEDKNQTQENELIRQYKKRLKNHLPDYMIPDVYVFLDEFPLTSNGKIDRKNLLKLDADTVLREEYIAPRTETEEALASIWSELLKVECPGIRDNFFALGGHSLLATQVVSRVRNRLQTEVALLDLFECPTIEDLSKKITELTESPSPASSVVPIVSTAKATDIPLSFSQQRLWFLDQLEPGSSAYNMPLGVRIQGVLDVELLDKSVNILIQRHKSFQTSFIAAKGIPRQMISPPKPFSTVRVDLTDIPESDLEEAISRIIKVESNQPFDLTKSPLLRGVVVRVSDEETIVLFTMHHIISDGWSIAIFTKELGHICSALINKKKPNLPELPVQYIDYSVWQREWLQGDMLEEQIDYWKQQLADIPILKLPTDKARPSLQSTNGAVVTIDIAESQLKVLKRLSVEEDCTLFMTLLAAFQILMSRYSGQQDFSIGTPIANRNHLEIEGLIGFFGNTLVIRADLSSNPTFRKLLSHVRTTTLEAYAHQNAPFERLVEVLQSERDMSRSPLFQVMFILQNNPKEKSDFPGLSFSPLEMKRNLSQFDLTMAIEESEKGATIAIEYNTDLFYGKTVRNLLKHYKILLESLVENPNQRISELELMTETERQRLLVDWNNNRSLPEQLANVSSAKCLHHLFEAQAKKTPDSVAIENAGNSLTYNELNQYANQIAHGLLALDLKVEAIVGVMMDRSLEMIASLLGVSKAGGAYLPLDPAYPHERITLILNDTKARMLLTQENHYQSYLRVSNQTETQHVQVKPVFIDFNNPQTLHQNNRNPALEIHEENLAYIIYTSGSTGKPKGVSIQHRSIVSYTQTAMNSYESKPGERCLQFASISFDAAAEEIFPCLSSGGTLVLRSDDMLESEAFFLNRCGMLKVDVLNLPTSYWHELVTAMMSQNLELPSTIRLIIIGGERVLPEKLELWGESLGYPVRLVNTYGPTEATVVSTSSELNEYKSKQYNSVEVPIGRSIENTQVYILDQYLQPVPPGGKGEIFIGGDGLARGYLNQPGLTASRFVPNSFVKHQGSLLYKSGDVGRYLPNGEIEYLGRVDHQVKVRGYRIELGEIEAVLRTHPMVKDAVVIVRDDPASSSQRIEAFFVPIDEKPPPIRKIRHFLEQVLPGYMIPSSLNPLESIPLNPSKKIDYKRLPSPEQLESGREERFVSPRDNLELHLIRIWEDVLKQHPIGIRDNFFELGGHSLLATHMVSVIEKQLAFKCPVASLFKGGTVESLAQAFRRQQQNNQKWSPLIEIQRGTSKRPLFFVHPGGGSIMCYLDMTRHLGVEQTIFGFQARGLEEGQQPLSSFEDMAAAYIEAMLTVQAEGPYYIGGWSLGGVIAFEMAQQLQSSNKEVAKLILFDSWGRGFWDQEKESQQAFLDNFARNLGLVIEDKDFNWERFLQLNQQEQLEWVMDQAKSADIIPGEFSIKQFERLFNVFKTNSQAMDRYKPADYEGQIDLFVAEKTDRELKMEQAHPAMGWEKMARKGVKVHKCSGDHFSMLYEPHVNTLVEQLKTCLNETFINT